MKKTFSKKLTLKKTDIASLSENEMKGLQGGYTESKDCGTQFCAPPPISTLALCDTRNTGETTGTRENCY